MTRRGDLRIHLGAAPGVGKTFAMLGEARRRQERGADVVVGIVETHGRARTAELLDGLEIIPRREIVDYVLNVAVSVAAGVAALTSAFPALLPWTVELCIAVLLVVAAINLRGVVAGGKAFALPALVFVGSLVVLIVVGLVRGAPLHPLPASVPVLTPQTVGVLLILAAFANGCAALTGVEAIANAGGLPVLAARLAGDGGLPHVFGLRGDRQVYRASIVVLTVLAAALLLAAGGAVSVLVPLFAIGVFVGFALCQAGMMRHWWIERSPRWRQRASLNLLGTVLTGAAAIVLVAEKFTEGAWLIVLVVPALVGLFATVRRAYARIGAVLEIGQCPRRPRTDPSVVVVPVVGISRLAEESLSVALSIGDRVVAVHVQLGTEAEDRAAVADLQRRWQEWRPDVALVLLLGVDEGGRPSRVLGPAIAQYLRDLAAPGTERVLLLIGEVAPNHWWEQVLFNRRGAVVARYAGRHTTAVVCRLRFRLLPRTSNIAPAHARRSRGLVLPRR